WAPLAEPLNNSLLRLRNRIDRRRKLSITSYTELVLGVSREATAAHVVTDLEESHGTILARNSYNNEFSKRIAFASTSERRFTMTCDRREFIGRNGSLAMPAAMKRAALSGRDGAGLDPCAAIQTPIELAPGEARQFVFFLGESVSRDAAISIIEKFRNLHEVNEAFEKVLSFWDSALGAIEIKTPDAS